MRPRTYTSALTLTTAMTLGAAAIAADLPKEGAYKGTTHGYGTFKTTQVGKDRLLSVWEENGVELTDGLIDHSSYRCWGFGDYINGVGQERGYCVSTDPAGDQIVQTVLTEKHAIDAPSYIATVETSGGTGKYAGMSGNERDACHSGEFKAPEGTYVQYCEIQGSYKRP